MTTTVQMTRNEIVAEIEKVTRARLGKSAAEVITSYREGRLADPGAVGDALVLADLLDPDDSLLPAT
ncbi:hypothetical protein [Amycolatopsis sp. MtRt-6]|uniref:hypothetical protein n=1 Tax=Amycolatopsis sp. MtRt-6 TaxID=2792782 RepID=UPI001A8D47E3|nr:hypothetical protein [Amycolatopsis sp. MtRt-6]